NLLIWSGCAKVMRKTTIRRIVENSMTTLHSHYGPSPLYPPIDAYETGFLKVSELHTLYYEQSGNPNGKPVIFSKGGPGGGISPSDRQYFDPSVYRLVAFDQRGSGKSMPPAELTENNTWALVSDIEMLREKLNIDKWVVFGGSWGSTLSLSYAITHPSRVKALILRGIFILRESELKWFYQDGASHIFPDAFDLYKAPIPENERHDYISAYYKRLISPDPAVRREAGKAWSTWEMATSKLFVDAEMIKHAQDDTWADQFARIECHFFINKGFFEKDGWILENVDKIQHIPTVIVQVYNETPCLGRYDVVCPATTAWELHKKLPDAEFHFVADSGHSAKEPGTTKLLSSIILGDAAKMSVSMSNVSDEVDMPDKMEAHRLRREEKDNIHNKVLLEGAKMGLATTTLALAASFAGQKYSPAYRRLTLPIKISLLIAASTAGFFTQTDRAMMHADRNFAKQFSLTTSEEVDAVLKGSPTSPIDAEKKWDLRKVKEVAFANRYEILGYGYVGVVGSTLAYNFTRRDIFMTQKFVNARLVGQFAAIAGIVMIGAMAASSPTEEKKDAYYERIVNGDSQTAISKKHETKH
ncbi:hypothetical protein HK100_004846, partial [Physocladia obscura]